jgi:hypothetical protein
MKHLLKDIRLQDSGGALPNIIFAPWCMAPGDFQSSMVVSPLHADCPSCLAIFKESGKAIIESRRGLLVTRPT